jgi:mannose-6-phosphate isomerase
MADRRYVFWHWHKERFVLTVEIVELMAASDNVLNVGFTPDKNSTKLVAKAITAKPTPAEEILLKKQPYHKGKEGHTTVYAVPFEEFSILRVQGSETLAPITGPGIAIVTESEGTVIGETDAPRGSVWFVGAGSELKVKGTGEVWMAFYDGDKQSAKEVGKQ